jgi:Tol biopolymer transport system component
VNATEVPPHLPAPPEARSQARTTWGMRPAACGLLCLLVAGASAVVGYRRLWPYPPRYADVRLAAIVVAATGVGLWAGSRSVERTRKRAVTVAIAFAVAAPLIAASVVPGIAQPPDHAIPGGRTEAITAAPDGNFDLYLMPNGDPAELTALTDTDDRNEMYAVLDASGDTIAYTVFRQDGASDVHLLRLAPTGAVASDEVLLTGDGDRLAPTAWTPEGDLLVIVHPPEGRPHVDRVDVRTGARTTFLHNAGNVAYAPDGSQIAFSAPSASDQRNWDIWVADADGSHGHDVIDNGGGGDDFPFWSPDGRTLLFTSWASGSADVWTARADGTDLRDLTPGSPDRDDSFGWSSDGHVLFLSDRSHTGGVFQYFMNADGSDVQLALRI